jgi:hypothetical protein
MNVQDETVKKLTLHNVQSAVAEGANPSIRGKKA